MEVRTLLRQDQRDDVAVVAGAGGAPGAVQVGLVLGRRVDVDDEVDVVDMDASGRDVGRHHDADLAVGERLQATLTRILRQVSVQFDGGDSVGGELAGQLAGLVLGAGEEKSTG